MFTVCLSVMRYKKSNNKKLKSNTQLRICRISVVPHFTRSLEPCILILTLPCPPNNPKNARFCDTVECCCLLFNDCHLCLTKVQSVPFQNLRFSIFKV